MNSRQKNVIEKIANKIKPSLDAKNATLDNASIERALRAAFSRMPDVELKKELESKMVDCIGYFRELLTPSSPATDSTQTTTSSAGKRSATRTRASKRRRGEVGFDLFSQSTRDAIQQLHNTASDDTEFNLYFERLGASPLVNMADVVEATDSGRACRYAISAMLGEAMNVTISSDDGRWRHCVPLCEAMTRCVNEGEEAALMEKTRCFLTALCTAARTLEPAQLRDVELRAAITELLTSFCANCSLAPARALPIVHGVVHACELSFARLFAHGSEQRWQSILETDVGRALAVALLDELDEYDDNVLLIENGGVAAYAQHLLAYLRLASASLPSLSGRTRRLRQTRFNAVPLAVCKALNVDASVQVRDLDVLAVIRLAMFDVPIDATMDGDTDATASKKEEVSNAGVGLFVIDTGGGGGESK